MDRPEIDITLWNGERFSMDYAAPLNFLTGPKLSGKSRFAALLNRALPNAILLSPVRGRTGEAALELLLEHLRRPLSDYLIVDTPEEGLTPGQQRAFMAEARNYARWGLRPVFLVTGSAHICDLSLMDQLCAVVAFESDRSVPRPLWGAAAAQAGAWLAA